MKTIQRRPHVQMFRTCQLMLAVLMTVVLIIPVPELLMRPAAVQAQTNTSPIWSSSNNDWTTGVAWGDVDNDGDLDLAMSTRLGARLYHNVGGQLGTTASWYAKMESGYTTFDDTMCVAWGDVDNDGDLDLAVGSNGQPNRLYRNNAGKLTSLSVWHSDESDYTTSIAWGDMDGDGDLDLAVGNAGASDKDGQVNRIYRNDDGRLTNQAVWSSEEADTTSSVAWGDVDNDGDLDLAVTNGSYWLSEIESRNQPNRVYLNRDAALETKASWVSAESEPSSSVAWGDMDDDGDLDLAVANMSTSASLRIHTNINGTLSITSTWQSDIRHYYTSVAWGDMDSDGDLDLVAGVFSNLSVMFENHGDTLATISTSVTSFNDDITHSIALGDVDNDGDLDVAVGNYAQPDRIYRNEQIGLRSKPLGVSDDQHGPFSSAAWGDVDGDGDLDLAVGGGDWKNNPNRIYRNTDGVLEPMASWISLESDDTRSVAWGDVDGDGDLDLAVGNVGESNRLYRNDNGALTRNAVWSSVEEEDTTSVAWGDVDGDGDLDLAVGNGTDDSGQYNRIYRNDDGRLTTASVWATIESDSTASIAWGDMDSDGDLDLLVGSLLAPVRMYRNDQGFLIPSATWSSPQMNNPGSIALGDVDGDGDLDLAVGNYSQPNRLYRNDGGMLTNTDVWHSLESDATTSVAWGDVDSDGDLDLAIGNRYLNNRIYRNDRGVLSEEAVWSSSGRKNDFTTSVAWGDVNGDGDLDLAITNQYESDSVLVHTNVRDAHKSLAPVPTVHIKQPTPPASADFFASAHIWDGPTVSFRYTLSHPESLPVQQMVGYYSLDGGGNWQRAIATSDTLTTTLESSPAGTTHTYTWDVYASGVMGQSDNVVFRLVAIPAIQNRANQIAGPYMRGSYATTTYPFRVRGTQIRVIDTQGQPAANALVYHLPANNTRDATPFAPGMGTSTQTIEPFRTNAFGYLQGRGKVEIGDKLMALAPIEVGETSTLYYTSAAPNEKGVDFTEVQKPGLQTLTVHSDNPLILFNLDVSLEWDARNDQAFLTRLRYDLARTSELLFDWTNGQAALGTITVFHAHEYWDEAHIRIYATNRLRPNAEQGGIVEEETQDPTVATTIYEPGQVRIGAVWNRFGETSGNLSEDWSRTLAHELGHYLFFLDDNYIGLNEDNVLVPVETCTGAMSDPYRDDYSEFVLLSEWLPGCQKTLSHKLTGRADWQTISAFYPWLTATKRNDGPFGLPLRVTDIQFIDPITPTDALDVPIFYLNKAEGGRFQPGPSARALLFQRDADYAGDYPWVLDIGRPVLDYIEARGAYPGDRLCLYDDNYFGCKDITTDSDQMEVHQTTWKPDIVVSPVTSRTINLRVSNIDIDPGDTLFAHLFPEQDPSHSITLTEESSGVYTGTFVLENPAEQGYVIVELANGSDTQSRQAITDYSMGGNPGRRKSRGGRRKSRGGRRKSRGGRRKSRGAPAVSSDGQVIIYGDNLEFDEGEFYTLQAATRLQSIKPWMSVVGQAYWLSASEQAPAMTDTSISFGYLASEVPTGEEDWLAIYFWDDTSYQWKKLPTSLDTYQNVASAVVQGPGLYALMSSVELPLTRAGWNLFAYPVQETRGVTDALQSIQNRYTSVYGYEAGATPPWRVYDSYAPEWANTLPTLSFGKGYWIHATQPVTLALKSRTQDAADITNALPNPPATYYGVLEANETFLPSVGMRVTATISGTVCGESTVQQVDDTLVVLIHVESEWLDGNTGCGKPGRPVTFTVGDYILPETYVWDNTSSHNLNGYPLYLPLVVR